MIESTKEFWEKAYQRNIGKMIGICYRYTGDRQLAEDLAHDAFLKAIDKSGSFEGRGNFDAWLRRILVNHVLQYLRDKKKKPYMGDLIPNNNTGWDPADDTSPVKETGFSAKELLDSINQLPEHHKLVFNLYVMEHFTHAQIGKELGISPGTSKSHLARARKKLKQLLSHKTEAGREEKERKKILPFFPFLKKGSEIDQIYRGQLENFTLAPKTPVSLDSIDFTKLKIPSITSAIIPRIYFIAATMVIIISAVFFIALIRRSPDLPAPKEDAKLIEISPGKAATLNNAEENDTVFDIQTATISPDSVILNKHIKQTSMRPLDSLAMLLMLSTINPPDSISPADYIKDHFANADSMEISAPARNNTTGNPNEKEMPKLTNTEEQGTFYASRLFWSKDNHEIYFKGKVTVDFTGQHFTGSGTFNFLGSVYLLIFNGEPATLGSTIRLSEQPYQLVRLDSKEASKKYGTKGQQGAIEISVVR